MTSQHHRLDRVRELANIGAGHAAGALAKLVGRTIWMEVPRADALREDVEPRAASFAADGAAVFFELQGGIAGMMAVIFSRPSLEVMVMEMMGADAYGVAAAVESAVREAGNIIVSHYVSAIADTLGAAVIPSVPLLAGEAVPEALAAILRERRAGGPNGESTCVLVESPLFDPSREVEGFLVLVVD
jgi:chemotaxis protein CheC